MTIKRKLGIRSKRPISGPGRFEAYKEKFKGLYKEVQVRTYGRGGDHHDVAIAAFDGADRKTEEDEAEGDEEDLEAKESYPITK